MFKDQTKKPCVFTDITGVIKIGPSVDLSFGLNGVEGDLSLAGEYISDDDQCILEDSSGRIWIKAGPNFKFNEQVTGTIMAMIGVSDA